MGRLTAIFFVLTGFLFSSHALATDLDSTDPNNGFSLFLGTGLYKVTYIQGAWNAWNGDTSCPGTYCHGWLNSYNILSADETVDFDVGAPFDSTWATASQAESLGQASPFFFTVNNSQLVKFFIADSDYSDNVGGISISVAAVPEPETYAMMLAGLGLLGLTARRRSQKLNA